MKSILCAAVALGALAQAQTPSQSPAKAAFEVASIKPAQPMQMGRMRIGMQVDGGMLRYSNVALRDVIRVAYKVKEFQVEGPEWLGSSRFDIVAKLPDGSAEEQAPEMLQSLLAERFKMTLHRETKDHAIYALIPGKGGPKLKAAEFPTDGDGPKGGAPPNAPGAGSTNGKPPRGAIMISVDDAGAHLKASSMTVTGLSDALSRFSERPVVDMTNIQGQYDFDLVFSPENLRRVSGRPMGQPPAAAGGDHAAPAEAAQPGAGSIYDSVQKYGLKLDPRKAAMEVLVIDRIEKTPTEN
jgi:uncharacterized protein (TIGR03435 family)